MAEQDGKIVRAEPVAQGGAVQPQPGDGAVAFENRGCFGHADLLRAPAVAERRHLDYKTAVRRWRIFSREIVSRS
ncbi:hypothetical protein Apmu_0047_05 [Acidiphilium multivorum AIU301]|nr:hypothetical protein Apmu_0047_05 [Acidiphilium multivorum AIU301]